MPNITELRQAANAGQAAAKEGLGFGRSGNPTLRGTLRRMSRQVKHRVQDYTGRGGADAARKGQAKAEGVNALLSEQAKEVKKLPTYQREVESTAARLRRTGGGEEAAKALRGSPERRKLPYNTPANKAEADHLMRTSQSGQEAADDFLRSEQKRFISSADTAYAKDRQRERLTRHANTYKARLNQANERVKKTTKAIDGGVPALTASTAIGASAYQDVQSRKSDGENNLSGAQKHLLKRAPVWAKHAKNPKERREIYDHFYSDAMSLPRQSQTLTTASALGGAMAGGYGTRSPVGVLGGGLIGLLGSEAINSRMSAKLREEALERTKNESNKDFRDRVKRLADQKRGS